MTITTGSSQSTNNLPVFYRGTTLYVVTAEVTNPSGVVVPPNSTTLIPLAMNVIDAPFFNLVTGVPQDPNTVTLMVRCEGKQKVEYTFGASGSPIQRSGTGMYFAYLATDIGGNPGFGSGLWTIEWAGTGGVAALQCTQVLIIDPPVIPSWL